MALVLPYAKVLVCSSRKRGDSDFSAVRLAVVDQVLEVTSLRRT